MPVRDALAVHVCGREKRVSFKTFELSIQKPPRAISVGGFRYAPRQYGCLLGGLCVFG